MEKETVLNPIDSDLLVTIADIQRVPEFINFVMWFATPRQFRKPKTQKEFAEEIGVCEDTLTDWKRHPQFWPLMQQALSQWVKDRIPDAIGSLYKKVLAKGNAKDVESFLQLARMDITQPNKQ